MHILTINAGSSSLKYKVFHQEEQTMKAVLSGLIEGIGEKDSLCASHNVAFDVLTDEITKQLPQISIDCIAHRVVHGGNDFCKPVRITDNVFNKIKELSFLAPLHNPVNALGIECALTHFPGAAQIAIFDTGFHQTLPEYISRYAIDRQTADSLQIRRYGFHGINHEYVAHKAAQYFNKPLTDCNFISLHLGNGASACLIKNGQSFDTSMGMTPLAGLIMGSRCGDIDPAIPFYLIRQGFEPVACEDLLNRQSGLKGLTGDNDMRRILARMENHDESAREAIDMYVYAIQKIIGAYLTQTGHLDALIFTGGVGENAVIIREKIISSLNHLNFKLNHEANNERSGQSCHAISAQGIPVLIIKSDEEFWMASQAAALLKSIAKPG